MALWSIAASRALGLVSCLVAFEGGLTSSAAQDCSGLGFFASSLAVTGLAVYDIATAPASARRYNARRVSVAPYVVPRDRSYGLSVTWFYRKSATVQGPPVRVSPVRQDEPVRPGKSPLTAFALSLGSTVVPMAAGAGGAGGEVFLIGLIVGPSVGHFYANQLGRGLGTAALRAAGTAIAIGSIIGCFAD